MTNATRPIDAGRFSRVRRAFTLVELLVVLLIILLVSAVTLPTILSGMQQRQVGEAARTLQAALAGARDAAILNNAPRGIRLLPDPVLTQPPLGTLQAGTRAPLAGTTTWACNRFIPIEPAPDYREGRVILYKDWSSDPRYSSYWSNSNYGKNVLCILQSFVDQRGSAIELTSWEWNIRVGDRIQFVPGGMANPQFESTGQVYTVVGPVDSTIPNPEQFINYGSTGPPIPSNLDSSITPPIAPEFLLLVNGVDDDGDGFIDNGYDGVTTTFETEHWIGAQASEVVDESNNASTKPPQILNYVIKRRPVPSRGARETLLPGNVVIDLTTWNSTKERSRLPIDGSSRSIDVLIDPNGPVIQSTTYSAPSAFISPFLHFWLTDREGVVAPNVNLTTGSTFLLPLPDGTSGYPSILQDPSSPQYLLGERMLVTIFARTGNVTVNSLQNFNDPVTNAPNPNVPFFYAQLGLEESP
jgi:prepilin-type N-terminal cleavage/methylation domain-containing protein